MNNVMRAEGLDLGWHLYATTGSTAPNGIGGSLATPPLPHHRTYGSVYGGSADYAGR